MPSPPCAVPRTGPPARTCRRCAAACSGGDADAGVADRSPPPRRRAARRSARCARPRSVYLAALFSRLANTWASRVGSASTDERLGRQRDGRARGPCCSISGRLRLHGAAQRPRAAATGSLRSSSLPAADAADVQQVVDQPHQLPQLPLHHGAGLLDRRRRSADSRRTRGRCGSGPADCAARGPASPGTRPCAGRRWSAPPASAYGP